MNFKNIGSNVRDLRNEKLLTQEELAKRAGVSQSLVARIEGGELCPSIKTLQKVADALGVEISRLMEEGVKGGKA